MTTFRHFGLIYAGTRCNTGASDNAVDHPSSLPWIKCIAVSCIERSNETADPWMQFVRYSDFGIIQKIFKIMFGVTRILGGCLTDLTTTEV